MNEQQKLRDLIVIYETDFGWRYRVGRRDDGNYSTASDALDCAQRWMKSNPSDSVMEA